MVAQAKWLPSSSGGDPIQVGAPGWNAMLALNIPLTREGWENNASAIVAYVKSHQSTIAMSAAVAAAAAGSISVLPAFVPNPPTSYSSSIAAVAQTSNAPAENQAPCTNCAGDDPLLSIAGGGVVPFLPNVSTPSAAAAAAQTGNVSTGIVDVNPTLQIDGLAVAALLGFAWLLFFRK